MMRTQISSAALLIASVAALASCKEVVENNTAPFSFVGAQLGMTKDQVKEAVGIQFCSTKSVTEAKCFLQDEGKQFRFFGTATKSETVILPEPYTHIAAINFYFDGEVPNAYTIERAWKLEGRCLRGYDIDTISSKSNDLAVNVVVQGLSEIRARPHGLDFICLAGDGRFIDVSAYTSGGGAVKIYYLREALVDLYEKLFAAKEHLEQAAKKQKDAIIGITN